MTPYVVAEGIITEDMLEARDLAEAFMADLPDPEPGAAACHTVQRGSSDAKTYWSCHGLVRAFASMYPDWQVLDGFFGVLKHQHSWLYRFTPGGGVVILDLYPVAAGMPMMVDASSGSPWRPLYVESSISYRPNQREMWDLEADYALKLLHEARSAEPVVLPVDPPDDTVVEFPGTPVDPPVSSIPMAPMRPPPLTEAFIPVPTPKGPLIGTPPLVPQASRPVFKEASPPPERKGFQSPTMRTILERIPGVARGDG